MEYSTAYMQLSLNEEVVTWAADVTHFTEFRKRDHRVRGSGIQAQIALDTYSLLDRTFHQPAKQTLLTMIRKKRHNKCFCCCWKRGVMSDVFYVQPLLILRQNPCVLNAIFLGNIFWDKDFWVMTRELRATLNVSKYVQRTNVGILFSFC